MKYFLKWKGLESGPFTALQIKEMFETGKIGMLHRFRSEYSADWRPLSEFMDAKPFDNAEEIRPESRKGGGNALLAYFTYGLCGASFLSVYIYFALVAYSLYLSTIGRRRLAASALGLGSVMVVLGLVFFKLVYPVLVS